MVVWSTTISSSMSSGMSLSSLTMLAKTSLGCTRMRFLRRPDRGVTADLRRGGMTGMKDESEKKGRGGAKSQLGRFFITYLSRTDLGEYVRYVSVRHLLLNFIQAIYIHKTSNSVRLSRLPCRE